MKWTAMGRILTFIAAVARAAEAAATATTAHSKSVQCPRHVFCACAQPFNNGDWAEKQTASTLEPGFERKLLRPSLDALPLSGKRLN